MDEMMSGSFDGESFFWTPSEAWVLSNDKRSEANAAEVGRKGGVLSSARFGIERLFQWVLKSGRRPRRRTRGAPKPHGPFMA